MKNKYCNYFFLVALLSVIFVLGFTKNSYAATLYWYSAGDTDWTNVAHWYTDSNHITQASDVPQSNDDTILLAPTAPMIDLDNLNWIEPTSIDATTTGVSVTSANGNMISAIILGDVTFYDNAINQSGGDGITGNVTFHDNAINQSTITGNVTFYDNAINQYDIIGDVFFHDSASVQLNAVITGNAIFYDNATNGGIGINGPGTVTGDATFMYLKATGGAVTDVNGTANGNVGGITYDNEGSQITTWIFSTTDNNSIVTGNAIFNGSSFNRTASVTGHTTYNYSQNPRLLKFNNVSRVIELGSLANFSFTMFQKDGISTCSECTYTISVNPVVSISSSTKLDNQVTGSFTPTRLGTYSLIVTVTNPIDGSNAIWNDMFFVVQSTTTIASETERYYLRDHLPINNFYKGNGHDTGSMTLNYTGDTENRFCSAEIMDTLDEVPENFPISSLASELSTHIMYKIGNDGYIVVQRFASPDVYNFDEREIVPLSSIYIPADLSFQNLNFAINSPNYLYRLGIKLITGDPYFNSSNPVWISTSSNPSYIDLTYQYSITPLIRATAQTNNNILLISATEPSTGDTNNATIVLNNPVSGATSTNLLIGDAGLNHFHRPFQGYTTTISSDGTATLQATGITGITTINSVPLDITPNAGSIDVSGITTGSGNYPNHWVESGTGVTSATHTIGNLEPNIYYTLNVDSGSTFNNTYQANSSGQITFNYTSGYSTHIFDLTEASNEALITSFNFATPGATGAINGANISVALPYGTSLTSLTPTIEIIGSLVSPNSGVTQNFTNPVTYTVTADDGTEVAYVVSVTIQQPASGGSFISPPPGIGTGVNEVSTDKIGVTLNIGNITPPGTNVLTFITNINNFLAPESSRQWQFGEHSFQIIDLDLYKNIVTIIISSTPQTIALKQGEERMIDLDGDHIADISLVFVGTYINRAEITIKALTKETNIAPVAPITNSSFIFTKNLSFGMISPDVKKLQQYLNAHGFIVAKSGAGAPGKETTKFGAATRAALIKFQKANKISPAVGYFGSVTRGVINQ